MSRSEISKKRQIIIGEKKNFVIGFGFGEQHFNITQRTISKSIFCSLEPNPNLIGPRKFKISELVAGFGE